MVDITSLLTFMSIIVVLVMAITAYVFIYKMLTYEGDDFEHDLAHVFGPFFIFKHKKHSWD